VETIKTGRSELRILAVRSQV